MDSLRDLWSPVEMQSLAHYGICFADILAAYHRLLELPVVMFGRFTSVDDQQRAVGDVLGICQIPCIAAVSQPTSWGTAVQIVIAGASGDGEARSTCEVLKMMVQSRLHVAVAVAHKADDVALHLETASYLLAVLTRGVLADEVFVDVLEETAHSERAATIDAVMVVADSSFIFPSIDQFNTPGDSASEEAQRLSAFLRRIFSVLALPVSPHASMVVLEAQVQVVCHRFKLGNMQTPFVGHSHTVSATRSSRTSREGLIAAALSGGAEPRPPPKPPRWEDLPAEETTDCWSITDDGDAPKAGGAGTNGDSFTSHVFAAEI